MDIHITVASNKFLKNTNIQLNHIKVIPYNSELETKAKNALSLCIQHNTNFCTTQNVAFCFNISSLYTKQNLPYICLQLLKNNFLKHRINAQLFLKHSQEFNLTKKQAHVLLNIFIKMRFLHVLNQKVYLLFIKTNSIWDIHFIEKSYEKKFNFVESFNYGKQQKFIWTSVQLWKPRLIFFFKYLVYKRISFSRNIKNIVSMLQLGETSFDWSFCMKVDPSDFIVLQGKFDKDAMLIWHFILFDT